MIKSFLRTSKGKLIVFSTILVAILVTRLFVLTVVEHEDWSKISQNISIKGIYTSSPRGSIYDRNGKLLAGSKQIFSVKMSQGDLGNEELNISARELIKVLEKNNDKYEDNFPIIYKNNRFRYTFDKEKNSWLIKQGLKTNLTPNQAFNALRIKLGIPEGDRFTVQKEIQTKYNIYPPFSVKTMKYNSDVEKEDFLKSYNLDEDTSPKEAFMAIKEYYDLDKNLSNVEARKILLVRDALKSRGYRKYLPINIAKDVSQNTVMYLEENSDEIKGTSIISETKRYYPMGRRACHIIGYVGEITNDELTEYEGKGYSQSSMIGKEGVEGAFESVLKGQDGTRTVTVDNKGRYVATLSEVQPKKGKDVYLTIDSDLQKIAEDSLEKALTGLHWGGTFKSEFGNVKLQPAYKAKSGAVVAIDVETGDLLASASYPNYNLNIFSDGITNKEWETLQSKNPRDSLAPAPLYNIAMRSAFQPGSTFKPLTGIAAIEKGLNPSTVLYDDGTIKLGDRNFSCVVWNLFKKKHGPINLYRALEVSCNYYFYDIATGRNWATNGSPLGYKIKTEDITRVAEKFGLGHSTGIEIPETVVSVPSEKKKIRGLQGIFANELYADAETYFIKSVYSNNERLKKDVKTIIKWLELKKVTRNQLYSELLPKVGIKEKEYENIANIFLYDYYNQAKWSVGDAFNISIGQGDNAYTPLQMANYVATLGNRGYRNKVSLIKSIEDRGPNKKPRARSVNLRHKEAMEHVLVGMERVSVGRESTLQKQYAKFPWRVAAKTGTAQREGYINPKSEVEYIKSHLSSFGNISWTSVKKEMRRLMKKYPDTYLTEDIAVRKAVINVSKNKVTYSRLDSFKGTYDEFGWLVALAPADNPKIAVAVMLVQGKSGYNASPIAREVIGQYLKKLEPEKGAYKDFKIVNTLN